MSTEVRDFITYTMTAQGFDHWQWVPLNKPLSIEFYRQWLADGLHGDMQYLQDSSPVKGDPAAHFTSMQSIIILTENYFPAPRPALPALGALKIAHYANNEDYHSWLRQKMTQACTQLKTQFPDQEFLAFTDAVPLLERDHAYQAGLGWIGKNTCLISRQKGSLFFIGEILSSLPTDFEPPLVRDFCGTCTRCIDACPTGALAEERVLDARKCIAYWNIEAKSLPPEDIRPQMADWFFGCDICQTVCPWNIKLHSHTENFTHNKGEVRTDLINQLRWILTTSNKKLMKELGATPLARAGGRGLKRNAIIVAANKKLAELKEDITRLTSHPQLGDLAAWALELL